MNLVRRFLENKALTLAGIFLVMIERNNVCRDFEREIREAFGRPGLQGDHPAVGQVRGSQRPAAVDLRARPEERRGRSPTRP